MVASAASDWALDLASYPMSVMIAAGGISAALFGKWTIKVSLKITFLRSNNLHFLYPEYFIQKFSSNVRRGTFLNLVIVNVYYDYVVNFDNYCVFTKAF